MISQNEIRTLVDAALQAGIADHASQDALLAGLPPGFVGLLQTNMLPAMRLLNTLQRLNGPSPVATGQVPLQHWLQNAALMTASTAQGPIFASALSKVSSALGAPPPPANLADLPEVKEAVIHYDATLPVGWLAGGALAAQSVALLEVPRYEGGQAKTLPSGEPWLALGTGWMVAPDLLMTCHHVVNARDQATPAASDGDLALQGGNTRARFEFDHPDNRGNALSCTDLVCADPTLDYALLRLPNGPAPLAISADAVRLEPDTGTRVPVNIIQHMGGSAKRVGCRKNLLTKADDHQLRYLTDTEGGSSGAPVMDDRWRVFGLHRATWPTRVTQADGKQINWVNGGTQIEAILLHIKRVRPDIHTEILGV